MDHSDNDDDGATLHKQPYNIGYNGRYQSNMDNLRHMQNVNVNVRYSRFYIFDEAIFIHTRSTYYKMWLMDHNNSIVAACSMTNGYYWKIVLDGCSPVDMAVAKDDIKIKHFDDDSYCDWMDFFTLIDFTRKALPCRSFWHQDGCFCINDMIQLQQLNPIWHNSDYTHAPFTHASSYLSNTLLHLRSISYFNFAK